MVNQRYCGPISWMLCIFAGYWCVCCCPCDKRKVPKSQRKNRVFPTWKRIFLLIEIIWTLYEKTISKIWMGKLGLYKIINKLVLRIYVIRVIWWVKVKGIHNKWRTKYTFRIDIKWTNFLINFINRILMK